MASLEIFEPEVYLLTNKSSELVISKYLSCFRKGILIGTKPLYYLLKGSYAEITHGFYLNEEERISSKSIKLLLGKIKGDIGECSIFITPHIFTKFIHELREGVNESEHFRGILQLLIENFPFIKEEELKKEEIIGFEKFKNRYCGISETAIILLKNKIGCVGVIDTSSNKIPEVGGEDYLFIDFPTLVNTIKEYERRELID